MGRGVVVVEDVFADKDVSDEVSGGGTVWVTVIDAMIYSKIYEKSSHFKCTVMSPVTTQCVLWAPGLVAASTQQSYTGLGSKTLQDFYSRSLN